jgi:glycerate-2-kinase
MVIKNFEKLAHSNLRKQLLSIAEEGYKAINTTEAVKRALKIDKNTLSILGKKYDLKKFKRIFVFAFGKAGLESSEAIKQIINRRAMQIISGLTFRPHTRMFRKRM